MLGFMTKRQAKAEGFTHHARLYSLLPCYYREDGPNCCALVFKWQPLEWLEEGLRPLWCYTYEAVTGEDAMFGIQLRGEL